MHASTADRHAITLLEVLLAIMVLSIGLLGLATLLPVGRYQMQQASNLDYSTALGRAAFRQAQIAGILYPENWIATDNSLALSTTTATLGPVTTTFTSFVKLPGASVAPPFAPVIIDPLMIAAQSDDTSRQRVRTFPMDVGTGSGIGAGAPVIGRVSLRQNTTTSNAIMPMTVAERYFRCEDDGVYNTPTQRYGYPSGVFKDFVVGTQIYRNQVRQSEGNYTWLAMVTPDMNESAGWTTMPGNALSTRQFKLSVVVFNRRPIEDLATSTRPVPEERICWLDFMLDRSGSTPTDKIRNVDARLRVIGTSSPVQADRLLNVRTGQWIGAMQKIPESDGMNRTYTVSSSKQDQIILQWYRVVAANTNVQAVNGTSDEWYRSIRIAGRDWIGSGVDANNRSYNDFPGTAPTAYGILIDGAIGVYEKTATLDRTSPWAY